MDWRGWGSGRGVLGISETAVESSFNAGAERPFTGAIVSTSRSGSAAVWTRNRGIVLGVGSECSQMESGAVETSDNCLR